MIAANSKEEILEDKIMDVCKKERSIMHNEVIDMKNEILLTLKELEIKVMSIENKLTLRMGAMIMGAIAIIRFLNGN